MALLDDGVIRAEGVGRRYGDTRAVQDIDLRVSRGEIVGLIGPNGSGKSTLINLISGTLKPDAGRLLLAGTDMARAPAHRLARGGVARTFQLVRVVGDMTALENVMAGLTARSDRAWNGQARDEARALLARVGRGAKGDVPAAEQAGEHDREHDRHGDRVQQRPPDPEDGPAVAEA